MTDDWQGYEPIYGPVIDEMFPDRIDAVAALYQIGEALKPFFDGIKLEFERLSQSMILWWPVVQDARRAEARRVHSQYRQKRGKRW